MLDIHNHRRQEPMSFQTYDHTVRDICSYLGDDEAKTLYIKVARFLRLALEELHLYMIPKAIKSVVLNVNSNMTVDLPADFTSLAKVGVCCDGKIRLIGRNDDLCIPGQEPVFDCCDCENEETSAESSGSCCASCTFHNVSCDDDCDGPFTDTIFRNAGMVNYLYGYTPKMWRNGTYRLDERNNRLIMGDGYDVCPGAEIVVEYNAALSDDQYDLIPKKTVPTLMYKTASMIKADKNPNASRLEFQNFKIHYRQLKKTFDTYTLEDLVAALRGTYKSSPKR
jgi:hypothetical protein